MTLDELGKQFIASIEKTERLVNETKGCGLESVMSGIASGELATKMKRKLPHGQFTPWINAHTKRDPRTIRNYVVLYLHRDRILSVKPAPAGMRQAYLLV